MARLKNTIIIVTTRIVRILWTKARPKTATIETTAAVIWMMMTLETATVAIATAAIATRVIRPIGI